MSDTAGALLFALDGSRELGMRIAGELRLPLGEHEEREFVDGEHKARPLENVRGRDVYIVHSLNGDGRRTVNDKLLRLLLFAGAVRDAGALRTTTVVPYLCYARKDRRTKPYDPVSTRYVAAMFEAVGIERTLTVDVHNIAAYQNAFRRGSEHLEARHVLVHAVAQELDGAPAAVVSPDAGGAKRAERFRESLEEALGRPVTNAILEKRRSAGEVSGGLFAGDVKGRVAVIVDDLIAGGTTMSRAAVACRDRGAVRTVAVATHAVFTAEASLALGELDLVLVTDTVQPAINEVGLPASRLRVVSIDSFLAEAVRRLHASESLTDMSETYG